MEANEMGTLPVGKLLRKMSMPLIISMFVQVLYSLVDSLYVAQLGDNALTAISLCMPVQFLTVGVGMGIGVGVNSVLSTKLGAKDRDGVIQEILDMSISYSMVLCVFSFAALHQIMMERLLSAIGRADLTMIPMLTGAVVNIILDPIMIFGWLGCPAMGITGAGIATVIGQGAAAVAGLLLNLRFNREVHITAGCRFPLWSCCGLSLPCSLSVKRIPVSWLCCGPRQRDPKTGTAGTLAVPVLQIKL